MRVEFERGDQRVLARMLGLPDDSSKEVIASTFSEVAQSYQRPGPGAYFTAAGSPPPADRRDFARRDALIAEAVAAGKFSPERAGHYKSQWDRNPAKAEATIAKLRPGVAAPSRPSSSSDDAYPADWLPENRVKPGGNTRSD